MGMESARAGLGPRRRWRQLSARWRFMLSSFKASSWPPFAFRSRRTPRPVPACRLSSSASTGATMARSLPPISPGQHPGNHCIFCFAGTHHSLAAPPQFLDPASHHGNRQPLAAGKSVAASDFLPIFGSHVPGVLRSARDARQPIGCHVHSRPDHGDFDVASHPARAFRFAMLITSLPLSNALAHCIIGGRFFSRHAGDRRSVCRR